MHVCKQVKALEAAGAFAAEIEVVPMEVATPSPSAHRCS